MQEIKKATINNRDYDCHLCDFMIIGAGISGSNFAYRLINDAGKKSKEYFLDQNYPEIILIEKNSYVGGRLQSDTFPFEKKIPIEMGGKRFNESDWLINNATNNFGEQLTIREYRYETNFFYLRGQHIAAEKLVEEAQILYHFRKREENKTPQELIKYAVIKELRNKLKEIDQSKDFNFGEWYKEHKAEIRSGLKGMGWLYLLYNNLSSEAVQFIIDTDGYDSNFDNYSAVAALDDLTRLEGKYHYLKEGYQTLVQKMVNGFKEKGGKLMLNTEVIEVKLINDHDQNFSDCMLMTYPNSLGWYAIKIKHLDEKTGIKLNSFVVCKHLIFATPKNALRKINQYTSIFDPSKHRIFNEMVDYVYSQNSLKVFLYFHDVWWKSPTRNIQERFKVVTDGPIRMLFGVVKDDEDISDGSNSGILWVYPDRRSAEIYPIRNMMELLPSTINKHSTIVRDMKKILRTQIEAIFDKLDDEIRVPNIDDIAWKYHEEAYHVTLYGDRSIEQLIKGMIIPDDFDNLHVIGSAYSRIQAWAEGAMLTSEYLLQHYGVLPPRNMPKNYVQNTLFT